MKTKEKYLPSPTRERISRCFRGAGASHTDAGQRVAPGAMPVGAGSATVDRTDVLRKDSSHPAGRLRSTRRDRWRTLSRSAFRTTFWLSSAPRRASVAGLKVSRQDRYRQAACWASTTAAATAFLDYVRRRVILIRRVQREAAGSSRPCHQRSGRPGAGAGCRCRAAFFCERDCRGAARPQL